MAPPIEPSLKLTTDYTEIIVPVTRKGGFRVKSIFYSAPSQLIGQRLRVHPHDTMIGVDLAKRVFHLHVASMTGHLKERKKLTPLQFRHYMADAPKCVVVSRCP